MEETDRQGVPASEILSNGNLGAGCYKNLDQALGQDLASLKAERYPHLIHQKKGPGRLQDLAKFWGGGKINFAEPAGETSFKFLMEKKLEGGRKVVALARLEGGLEEGKESTAVYRMEKLIFQGPKGGCVNFLERIPKNIRVRMRVGQTTIPADASYDSRRFWYSDDSKEINIGQIKSFRDVASIWHEGGHVVYYQRLSKTEREWHHRARAVFDYAVKAFEGGRPSTVGKDYLVARWVVGQQERLASSWAVEDLNAVKDLLVIDPHLADKISGDLEGFLQTYDFFLMPDVAVSELAQKIPASKADLIYEHMETYRDIRYWLEEHGLDFGEEDVFGTSSGEYRVALNKNEDIEFTFTPNNFLAPRITGTIGVLGGIVNWYYFRNFQWRLKIKGEEIVGHFMPFAALSLHIPKTFIRNHDKRFLAAEKDLEKGLIETSLEKTPRKEAALKDIEWLKAIFLPIVPDIEELDPMTKAKRLMGGGELKPSAVDNSTDVTDAINPVRRRSNLCAKISARIIERVQLKGLSYDSSFDPETGRRIGGKWELLVMICEKGLRKLGLNQEIPDRFLTNDPKAEERKLIEMAARYFAESG